MTQSNQTKKSIEEIKFLYKTNVDLWTLLEPLIFIKITIIYSAKNPVLKILFIILLNLLFYFQ